MANSIYIIINMLIAKVHFLFLPSKDYFSISNVPRHFHL